MIRHIVTVGIGGFIGATARFGISSLIHRYYRGGFPAGTLVVNTLGCFAIGVFMCLLEERQLFSPNVRSFCVIGILGAFTTFSTFGYETFELIRESSIQLALRSVAANLALGIAAIAGGQFLAGFLSS